LQGAITAGQYRPGERLPTHRALAREFNVAIGTVTRAVDTLSRQGVVRGEVGRGTFVTEPERAGASPMVDLSLNAFPPVLPAAVFEAVFQRALARALALPAGGYSEPAGSPGQRAVLSTWLARSRVNLGGDELLPVVGGQQGLALAFDDLRAVTAAVAMEPATFPGAVTAARQSGLDVLPVAIDREGVLPDALDKVLRRADVRAFYTTPVAQSPLGFETGEERRRAIVAVCRKRKTFIIEDDIYGAFATPGIPTYRELAPELTYYINSFSKAVTPLIRLGVLAPPRERRASVAERLRAQTWSAAPFSIVVACEFIEGEHDQVAAARLREEATERLSIAREALGEALPRDARPGPHLWLPMDVSAAEQLARRAIERGLRLTPPSAFLLDPSRVSGIRVCVLAPRQRSDLARALASLASLLHEPSDIVV
jgi:DNA-binding transcriptional MocR family regulator